MIISPRLLVVSLFLPVTTFAAGIFDRPITLPPLAHTQTVFLTLPEEAARDAWSARVLKDGAAIPQRFIAEGSEWIDAGIASVAPCSLAAGDRSTAMFDENRKTAARPDPFANPSSCTLTLKLRKPLRVDSLEIDADQPIKQLRIFASDGSSFVRLGESRSASLSFSSVTTDTLRVDLSYDIVPHIAEIRLARAQPTRILFEAVPGESYLLRYGQTSPDPLPKSSEFLRSSALMTPSATVGTVNELRADHDNDGVFDDVDNCIGKSNPGQENKDRDASGDACDPTDDRFSEQHPWVLWTVLSFLVLVLLAYAARMVMMIGEEKR